MKQYFTGFFTAVCLTASVFIFMGSQNKNLGDIEVNSISVRTADGKEPIYIGYGREGDGYIQTFNADGKQTANLGTSKEGGGHLKTYNADGKETVFLGTGVSGIGYLKTYNSHGVETGYFGTDKDNDGIAVLSDRYGDIGWGQRGKQ